MADRTARRKFAMRLRELREGAFPAKVKQDELAAALGTNKPLSTAAISTWENGEIDKRPSEQRVRQYALIFSAPYTPDTRPHLPDETALTQAEHAEYTRLREELIQLRESAEDEARREKSGVDTAGGELWHHPRDKKVIVVTGELPQDQQPVRARKDTEAFDYVRLARYADLDAFFTMYTALTRLGYEHLSHRAAADYSIGSARDLVLIGSPPRNYLTGVFTHLLHLPITQHPGSATESPSFELSDGGTAGPTIVDVVGGGKQLIEDVGMFVRATNPANPDADLTICAGLHTAGVLGATQAFTHRELAQDNIEVVRQRLGQATSFAAVFRVKVVDGRVPTPRLTSAMIECVPLD